MLLKHVRDRTETNTKTKLARCCRVDTTYKSVAQSSKANKNEKHVASKARVALALTIPQPRLHNDGLDLDNTTTKTRHERRFARQHHNRDKTWVEKVAQWNSQKRVHTIDNAPKVLQTKFHVSKSGEPSGQRFGPTGKSNLTLGYSCVNTNEEVVAQSRRQRRCPMAFSKMHVKTSPGNFVTWNWTCLQKNALSTQHPTASHDRRKPNAIYSFANFLRC